MLFPRKLETRLNQALTKATHRKASTTAHVTLSLKNKRELLPHKLYHSPVANIGAELHQVLRDGMLIGIRRASDNNNSRTIITADIRLLRRIP